VVVEAGPDVNLIGWQQRLLERNRRGARLALSISLVLFPLFGLLDWLLAPSESLPLLWGARAAILPYFAWLLWVLPRPVFERHFIALTAVHIYLAGASICVMTFALGGLASPYYAGLNLVLLGGGFLYLWPGRTVFITYTSLILSWLLPAMALERVQPIEASVSNLFFLVSTAIIVAAGQVLQFRADFEQFRTQSKLAAANEALSRAKAQVEQANADLKQLDAFKNQLFANITHELRTPLAMILTPTEMMLHGDLGPLSDAAEKSLTTMHRAGTKLLKLINDLLDLSKLEESRLQLYIAEHDLLPWLEGLVAQVEPLAQRKEIALTLRANCPEARVHCDIERMERVVVNLLSNAVKFTPAGGSVVVELEADAEAVRLRVRDSGEGFPPELAERLFERFFQVDMGGTRKFGGTGIGLALARELVELHGGTIRAEGAPGHGATFHVALRRGVEHIAVDVIGRPDEPDRDLSTVLTATAAMPRSEGYRLLDIAEATERRVLERDADEGSRSHTVLIVEDNPDVARIIHLALRRDFRVMHAADGLKGEELALRHRPDLIITDLMMPGIDGLELVRRLRADSATAHIPIIMLTARGAVEDRTVGLAKGVNAYLAKPFSARELVANVHSLLGFQASQAERLMEGRMDSLETIAGGLAHEINNPLNYIKAGVGVLEGELGKLQAALARLRAGEALSEREAQGLDKGAARSTRMIESARAGVERIAKTVELMRRYSREGYSRVAQPVDVGEAVRDVCALVGQAVHTERALRVEAAAGAVVRAVPEELHQVLTNLVQNALEACAAQPDGEVQVRVVREGAEVRLEVRDNGPGMDAETRERVFTPFFSTKGPGRGMGLGLTITWRVVHALGGKIVVDSEPGKGTLFTVRLPAADANPAPAA
jgi:signal transduction histidine kinase